MNYVVQSGDSLSKIGAKFNVSWNTIALKNNIRPPYTIRPGQTLNIPTSASGGGASPTPVNAGGSGAADFSPVLDKVIGGVLLYGIFRVLMKVF